MKTFNLFGIIVGAIIMAMVAACESPVPANAGSGNTPIDKTVDKQATAQPLKIREVIIDAGHGGEDNGAAAVHIINGKEILLKEKDVSLGLAIALKKKLLLTFPDTKVSLTREEDVRIPFEKRMEPINSRELDTNETALYISIHTNWSSDTSFRGYRFFVNERHPKNDESFQLAAMLSMEFAREYKEHEIPNRGILERQFITFINPYIPVVMLEMGNINNLKDALLYADEGLERCAAALAKGIAAYIAGKETNSRSTLYHRFIPVR